MFLYHRGALTLSIIFFVLVLQTKGQLSLKFLTVKPTTNDPGDPVQQNQKIATIFSDSLNSLEERIEILTKNVENYFEVTGELHKFSQNIKNLTNRLEESVKIVKTPENLIGLLNSSGIVQNINNLDSLNPRTILKDAGVNQDNLNNSEITLSRIWTHQLQLLTETPTGIQLEEWAVSNLTETLKKFSQFLSHQAYASAQNLDVQILNLTMGLGAEFLKDVKKLDLTVPRRQPASAQVEKNEWNVTAELVIEREEEGHDLRLKNVQEILSNRSNHLDKLITGLEGEETVRGFVQRILSFAEGLTSFKNFTSLHRLSTLVSAKNGEKNGIGDDIGILENFGTTADAPLRRQEWIKAGFEKFGKFLRNKLNDIEQRERDRTTWKGTQEYQRVQAERERQDRVIVGSYAITCKSKCIKDKDYFYCTNGSQWDYCSPDGEKGERDYKNKKCVDTCGHKGYGYKWCRVEGGSWGYCSTFKSS